MIEGQYFYPNIGEEILIFANTKHSVENIGRNESVVVWLIFSIIKKIKVIKI